MADCRDHFRVTVSFILGWLIVAYHFRVTVSLTLTSDLIFRILMSGIFLILFGPEMILDSCDSRREPARSPHDALAGHMKLYGHWTVILR